MSRMARGRPSSPTTNSARMVSEPAVAGTSSPYWRNSAFWMCMRTRLVSKGTGKPSLTGSVRNVSASRLSCLGCLLVGVWAAVTSRTRGLDCTVRCGEEFETSGGVDWVERGFVRWACCCGDRDVARQRNAAAAMTTMVATINPQAQTRMRVPRCGVHFARWVRWASREAGDLMARCSSRRSARTWSRWVFDFIWTDPFC